MKYKVGDKVRLKKAEELRKIGWCEEKAALLGNRVAFIERIDLNKYYTHVKSEEVMLFEEDFDCLISIVDGESYTLDELQSKVDEFKEYLAVVNRRNQCLIDVYFNTIDSCDMAINSEIRIRK